MNKTLQEKAQEKGKQLLIEEWTYKINPEDVEILTTPLLIESADGKKYEALGVLKNVSVSRYIENLNGRIYSKGLWKRVKEKKMGEGSGSLAGHPEGDGNPMNLVGVWHGLLVESDTPKSNLYIIEEKLLKAAKAGLPIGFSSVGFGEISEDGKTVVEESYELERMGDWVLQPSQQVYATVENLEESKENLEDWAIKQRQVKENKQENEKKVNIYKEDNTNKYIESVKINDDNKVKNEVLNMDKIQEAQFKNTINEQVSKAKKNENLFEAIGDLKVIDTADNSELQEKVNSAIQEVQKKIANKESELNTMLEEKDSTINELTENYDKAIKVADELKEKLNKVSSFIEQVVEAEEDFDSEVFVENYKTLKEDHEKVMAMFETDNFKKYEIDKLNDFVELVEDTIKRDTDIEDLKSNENDENLQEKLDVAENHIEECETKLKELGYEFEEAKVKEEDDEEEKDKEKKAGEKEADQEMKDEDDEEVSEKKEKKKEKKESKDPEVVKYVFDSDNKQKLSEKVDDEDDDEDELEEEKNNKITEEINSFFKGQTKKYPGLKDFKKEILGSKSLIEAVNKIDELKEEINEMVDFKITKKTKIKPDWFPKGRI